MRSALGDQLIGTGDLPGGDGRGIGTSSFLGISTDAKPRTSEMLTARQRSRRPGDRRPAKVTFRVQL